MFEFSDDRRRANALKSLQAERITQGSGGYEDGARDSETRAQAVRGNAERAAELQALKGASPEGATSLGTVVTTAAGSGKAKRHRLRRVGKKAAPPTDRVTRLQIKAISRKQVNSGKRSGVNVVMESDPKSYNESMTSAHRDDDSVITELDTLQRNRTRELVIKPPGVKALHSKWVFKTKLTPDGSIERRKARLVVSGSEQQKVEYAISSSLQS